MKMKHVSDQRYLILVAMFPQGAAALQARVHNGTHDRRWGTCADWRCATAAQ